MTFFATAADRIQEQWADPAGLGPPVTDSMSESERQSAQPALQEAHQEIREAINLGRKGQSWRRASDLQAHLRSLLSPPISGSSPVRLIVLDLDDSLDLDTLASFLPGGRSQMSPLLVSGFDAPRVVRQGSAKSPVDWDGVAGAIARLVAEARGSGANRDVEYYIAGRAPAPVFAQLGFELSAFTLPPTLLNRRKDGQWDSISLAAARR
jgi:hypothetical protein